MLYMAILFLIVVQELVERGSFPLKTDIGIMTASHAPPARHPSWVEASLPMGMILSALIVLSKSSCKKLSAIIGEDQVPIYIIQSTSVSIPIKLISARY